MTLPEALNSADAATAALAVRTALGQTHDPETLPILGQALVRFARRMRPEQAPALLFAGTSAQPRGRFVHHLSAHERIVYPRDGLGQSTRKL